MKLNKFHKNTHHLCCCVDGIPCTKNCTRILAVNDYFLLQKECSDYNTYFLIMSKQIVFHPTDCTMGLMDSCKIVMVKLLFIRP